jgi:transcriptional regulator with XRE-family HTH domain
METNVGENLKRIIAAQGLTWEEASRKCDLDRSYFRTLFGREGSAPRGSTLQKIARGLQIGVPEILGTPESSIGFHEEPPLFLSNSNQPATPSSGRLASDIEVRGTASGTRLSSTFQFTAATIGYVRRPPALFGASNIYALFAEGESMIPQFHPGDLIFVNPNKPARVEDIVIVRYRNPDQSIEATMGVYRGRTKTHIVIGKHHPAADIEINDNAVVDVHKVLTTNELFGF